MSSKEDLIREINIITTASSKYNLADPKQAEKMVHFFESKQTFKTQIGIKYIEQLKKIKSGEKNLKCFICKENNSYDGILCEKCMNKYTNGKKDFFGKDDFAQLNALYENAQSVKTAEKALNDNESISENQVPEETEKPKKKISKLTFAACIGGFLIFCVIFAWIGGSSGSRAKNKLEKFAIERAIAREAREYLREPDANFDAKIIYRGRKAGSDITYVLIAVEPTFNKVTSIYSYGIYDDSVVYDGAVDFYGTTDQITDKILTEIKRRFGFSE